MCSLQLSQDTDTWDPAGRDHPNPRSIGRELGGRRPHQMRSRKSLAPSLLALSLGMGRRIDIELTSKRDDGTWTWRAPGAREPRGIVDGGLLPPDATPGTVLRAEAEFELEGILVTSVVGSKTAQHSGREGERIEILGSTMKQSTVSVSLASPGGKGRGRGPGLFDDRPPARRGAPRGDRTDRDQKASTHPRRTDRTVPGDGDRAPSSRSSGERGRRPDAGAPPRDARSPQSRPSTPDRRPRVDSTRGPRAAGARPGSGERNGRPRALQASTEHRNAALALLRPEQLPVAEQLLKGGIPALRRAIDDQNSRARAEGRAEVAPELLLSMADELLPKMNLAAWKDRAVAARAADRDCPLRELRAVVAAASTVNVDDEGRELLATLRKSLDERVTALRESWLNRISRALDEGRIVEGLHVASRAPEPAMRLPAELAVRLSDVAGSAMRSDLDDQEWLQILEAVVGSPVRRTVKPAGLPSVESEAVLKAARHAAGSVPQLARLLGLPIPPPPGPRRPPRQLGPARRAAPA